MTDNERKDNFNKMTSILQKSYDLQNKSQKTFDNNFFDFKNIQVGTSCKVRFLPDGDKDNVAFWTENNYRDFKFYAYKDKNGTIVNCANNPISVRIPAFNLKRNETNDAKPWIKPESIYKSNEDPIEVDIQKRDLYNNDKELYNSVKRKTTYMFQLIDKSKPEIKIERAILIKELFNIVFTFITNEEVRNSFTASPVDYKDGCDFIIDVKKQENGYKSYALSMWARQSSALSAEELDVINEQGLYNLSEFVFKTPTEEEKEIAFDVYLDYIEKKPFDVAKYDGKVKVYGISNPNNDNTIKNETPIQNTNTNTNTNTTIDNKNQDDINSFINEFENQDNILL